jgi:monomeric sarcosine oxidase
MNTHHSTTHPYDIIVVGAGVMGSATAYHLARDGRRVLLLEQFSVGHTRGSSHGGSRIIRYTHDTHDYARVMPATFALWRQLEQESAERLLQMTGGLYIGPTDDAFLRNAQQLLQDAQQPYRLFTPTDLQMVYPQFRLPAGWLALFQEQSGVLAANRCVQTLVRQAIRHGAALREHVQVQAVEPQGDGVTVSWTSQHGAETLYAPQAVITAGPWAKRLLAPLVAWPLPLQATHQQYAYFAVEQPAQYSVERCPIFMYTADPYFYGFPSFERPGQVKLGIELEHTPTHPDQPRAVDAQVLDQLCTLVSHNMVGVNPSPVQVDLCLYTETPNRDFIIDRHPAHPQILIGAGFSGRGFKFAISVGRLLADLAQSPADAYNSEFWLPRFAISVLPNCSNSKS